jgi:cyclophilin family peptidyl-prolyl cis-trans isomerase
MIKTRFARALGLMLFCTTGLPVGSALAADAPKVVIQTNYGEILLELYPDKAPQTVANFLQYIDSGFYQNTIFHRVIQTFMIQGGGFDLDYQQKPTRAPVPNEANNGLSNLRGTIAMARTNQPHSATSQFFINTVDNPPLDFKQEPFHDWGYCVFGKVVRGMEVVDEIAATPTGSAGPFRSDVPQVPVIIEKISRYKKPETKPAAAAKTKARVDAKTETKSETKTAPKTEPAPETPAAQPETQGTSE